MRFTKTIAAALAAFLLPVALGAEASAEAAALAQSGTSTIAGVVTDSTAGALPGVAVRVVNEDTGVAVETFTNEEGLYRVTALVPGTYRVETMLDGFDPVIRRPITLAGQPDAGHRHHARRGGQSETVNVSAAAPPLVESQTSTVAQMVTREMLAALPLPNRAASSLASLAPGVIMIDTGVGTAENYPVFSVAGGRARNQNFILDGGNATNAVGLTRPQQLTSLPVDAMQEFKVITNNYAAEFGHSTGGVVTMSTRVGHERSSAAACSSRCGTTRSNARNFFARDQAADPAQSVRRDARRPGQAGRRRSSSASWERTRQLTSEPIVSTVPTLLQPARRLLRSAQQRGAADRRSTTRVTRQPFAGNVIPRDRLDPVALAALQYFPLPNRDGTSTNANNYVGNSESTLDRDILRRHASITTPATDDLADRPLLHQQQRHERRPARTDAGRRPAGRHRADVRVQSLTGAHTHIFSADVVNELRVTYLRRKFIDQRPGLGTQSRRRRSDCAASATRRSRPSPFPAMDPPRRRRAAHRSDRTARSAAPTCRASRRRSSTRRCSTRCRWSRGKHAYKFGVEYRAGANDEVRDRGSSGILTFSPLITSNLGAAEHRQRARGLHAGRSERGQRADLGPDSDPRVVSRRSTRRTTGA